MSVRRVGWDVGIDAQPEIARTALSGRTLSFNLNGQSCSAVTKITSAKGGYMMLVTLSGDGDYASSADSDPFAIN